MAGVYSLGMKNLEWVIKRKSKFTAFLRQQERLAKRYKSGLKTTSNY